MLFLEVRFKSLVEEKFLIISEAIGRRICIILYTVQKKSRSHLLISVLRVLMFASASSLRFFMPVNSLWCLADAVPNALSCSPNNSSNSANLFNYMWARQNINLIVWTRISSWRQLSLVTVLENIIAIAFYEVLMDF